MSREFVTKSSRFFCISLSPDVCKTPRGPGTPAVPYIIKGEFQDATGVSPNIRSNGEALALADSTVIPTVTGDEAGTAGGTTSGTYGKRVQHNEKSASVSFNGQRAIREGDLVWMNDKNTIGKIYMRGGEAPKVPGAPATAEERQFDREFEAAMASGDPARRISPALLALQPGCGSAAIAAAVAATAAQKTAVPAARSVPASDGGGGTSSGKASAKSDKPPSCGPAAAAPGGMAVSSRHPVHFGTGEEVLEQTDFVLDGAWPIAWTRCYRSGAECEDWGLLGARWATAFTASLSVTDKGVVYHDAGGRAVRLPPLASGQSHDSRKEGFVLEHSGDDAFTLTWRSGGVDAFIRAADGWLPHGYDGVNAMLPPGRPVRARRFVLRRSAARDGRGFTVERFEQAAPGAVLLRVRSDDGRLLEAMRAEAEGAEARDEAPRIGRVDEVRADGSRVCHVRYRYEAETAAAPAAAAFDDLPRRHDLVGQGNRPDQVRSYTYRHHLLTGFTSYAGFAHGLEWVSLAALRERWAGSALSDAQLAQRHPVTAANSYQARASATRTADGQDEVAIAYPGEETSRVTQADGSVFDYTFDDHWRATAVHLIPPAGRPQSLGRREWDGDGLLLAETDGAGHTVRYAYDGAGRLIGITDPLGYASRIDYDAHHQPVAVTDALGHTSRYAYDDAGRLVSTTDALGHTSRFRHDGQGLLVEASDAKGGLTRLAYEQGRLVSHTDCSGSVTLYAYDADGRLSEVTDALGQATRFDYDALGRRTGTIRPDGARESAAYDADGNLLAQTDAAGHATRYRYNGHGLPVERIDALGHRLHYRYDAALRLSEIVNANGDRHRFAYRAEGWLTSETGFDGRTTTYDYDRAGRLTATECAGQRVEWVRDAAGRLEMQCGPDGVVRYAHDALGRLSAVASAQAGQRLRYDALGRLVEERSAYVLRHRPEGPWEEQGAADASFVLTHAYDELGNRIRTTLPDGRRIDTLRYGSGHWHGVLWQGAALADVERDTLHRERARALGAAAPRLTGSRGYDPQSRLASMTLSTETETETGSGAAALLRRQYAYDPAGHLTRIVHAGRAPLPGGHTLHETMHYRYDALGRLVGVARPGSEERFAFDPAGNLLDPGSAAAPAGAAAPVARVAGNLLRQYGKAGYEYDERGNVVGISTRAPDGAIDADLALSYDAGNRIVTAVRTDRATRRVAQYFYDAHGRRIAKRVSTEKLGIARPAAGQPDQPTVETTLFIWDGDAMVQEIVPGKTVSHVYEPDSFVPLARIESDNGYAIDASTGRWQMGPVSAHLGPVDAWKPPEARRGREADADAAPAQPERSAEALHQSLWEACLKHASAAAPRDRILYYQCDHLGTPLELLDRDGAAVWAARYRAWGAIERCEVEQIAQAIRFQGQYEDAETGLYYNRHRYYDPGSARYVQSDPIGLAGGINTYAYVRGNPISYIDPMGLTREQVDAMLEKVRCNSPDLNVPDHVYISSTFGGEDTAVTNPMTLNVTLSSYYNGDLDADGLNSLYKTITHESIHRTKGRMDMIRWPFNHPDIYEEAAKRARDYAKTGGKGDCSCKK